MSHVTQQFKKKIKILSFSAEVNMKCLHLGLSVRKFLADLYLKGNRDLDAGVGGWCVTCVNLETIFAFLPSIY